MPDVSDPSTESTSEPEVTNPETAPAAAPYTVNDFEVDSFKILQDSEDYSGAVNDLTKLYNNVEDKEKAKDILAKYSDDLFYKTKADPYTLDQILAIAPVKPDQVEGETNVEKATNWETANIERLKNSNDPDVIASRDLLVKQVGNYASEMRRDELADTDQGLWAWSKDKALRFGEGAVGPISTLFGYKDTEKFFRERMSRERDGSIAGGVAGGLGSVSTALLAGAATGPIGAFSVFAAEGAGSVRGTYERSIDETKDEERALKSASLEVAAQAIQAVPLGKVAGKILGRVASEVEQPVAKTLAEAMAHALDRKKETFGNVARSTLEAGLAGSSARVLSNIGTNIGLNRNGDVTEGTLDSFIINGALVGALHGAHALAENVSLEQAKKYLNKANTETNEPPAPPPGSKPGEAFSKREVSDAISYVRDADGYMVEADIGETTVEQRNNKIKNDSNAVESYINEEPPNPEGIHSRETGEEVVVPYEADTEVTDFPDNTVILGEGGGEGTGKTNRFISYMFGKLGGTLEESRNIANGALGSFSPGKNTIKILRSLGADPLQFSKTYGHEFTHFLDSILNGAFEKGGKLQEVVEKLKDLKSLSDETVGSDLQFNKDAAELSQKWRPGWDGSKPTEIKTLGDKFNAYRARPEEILADVGSAIINDPEWVKTAEGGKFKKLYDAFEAKLNTRPDLGEFWSTMKNFETDPTAVTKFNLEVKRASIPKQGNIEAKAEGKRREQSGLAYNLKMSLKDAHQRFINRSFMVRRAVMRLDGAARDVGMNLLNDVQRTGHIGDYLERTINTPVEQVLSKIKQADIEPTTWAHYEAMQHVVNDVTNVMADINSNPEPYRKAASIIRDLLLEEKGTPAKWVEEIFKPENLKTPKDLSDAFAKVNLIGDVSHISLETYLEKYSASDPQRVSKATRDYSRALSSLNKRKESIPIERLRQKIDRLPTKGKDAIPTDVKKALQFVTEPNAFAARRYLLNEGGTTVFDAQNDIANIEILLNKEAPGKFNALQKISTEFHEILNRTLPTIMKSEMFSPELIQRIQNNSAHYVTTNVLKHFEGDESISQQVKSAIGSMSENGNPIASTVLKNSAITAAAYRQIGVNAAIKIADMVPNAVSKVKLKFGENVFDMKKELSAKDKDSSYLVGYEKGKAILYKIDECLF